MVSTTVRVVNDQGKDVKQDGIEIGEIIVKGPGVLEEQSGSDEINDGWLRTGDKGTIDAAGHVTIVERKKDISLNDEHAISTIELEGVFKEHPAVHEVAIILAPHKNLGEILHAIVVLHGNTQLTKKDLFDFVKGKIDEDHCPKEVTFMDELPKTPSGKIQKIQLNELV
ncbi:class I adenylate-forming enzyme family protein [Virgibacillus sp. DJP39]|uniref:class I adenylate-forming enzyme family protein n=1 Tax=Virgibacillus sp. DJP39 TaxID=3409790 RepID=UPI003BB5A74F